ncbi:MAG: sulfide/dihydroorotate dehydrogenase-like FAD/NAD-binding protein [Clostridium sp.]
MREKFTCIDLGTDYCPCHLAESGDCILCSQLRGKCFCECSNWNGVCIYNEFLNNKNKAKKGRETINCDIIEFKNVEDDIVIIKFRVSRQLAVDLSRPGAYIFLRKSILSYFEVPVSVMESNDEEGWIKVAVKISGVKTKDLLKFNNEKLIVRGPYYNGIFGLKELKELTNKKVLIIGRGIGLAPSINVINRLLQKENKVYLIKDIGEITYDFSKEYLEKSNLEEVNEEIIIQDGKLTNEVRDKIKEYVERGIEHIHIGGADITTYNIIEFLDALNRNDISISCCNNFKMSCGEGVCGACTIKYEGNKVRRYCKYQTDPRTVFEGRWLI